MASIINIVLLSNPTPGSVSFQVSNTVLGYSKTISKTFIPGIPTSSNYVQIGATKADTQTNLYNNLIANAIDGNCFFENISTQINMLFNTIGDYSVVVFTPNVAFNIQPEFIDDEIPVVIPPFEMHDISITIIDTYTNESILVDELAQANACKLEWNGGDDIYKGIIPSKLQFNMLVADASDAHFISLFTGDEKRFRVEVNAIDVDENFELIWQGYLLPDQYSEPYKNGVFFVDFVATDMLSVIKGNLLEPWIYESRYPIAKLLAVILKTTGLAQKMLVKPSIIPSSTIFGWDAINVNLRDFTDGKTFKDLNEILEAILKAQALTLFSYRGYWWIEGYTRKHEKNTTVFQFDVDGNKLDDLILIKDFYQPLFNAELPKLSAISPWKKVKIGFNANGTSNLFSDTVIKLDKKNIYKTFYSTGGYSGLSYEIPEVYTTVRFKDWIASVNNDFIYLGFVSTQLLYKINKPPSYDNYNYSEFQALSNYFECTEKPYVKPGILYEFEAEFKVDHLIGAIEKPIFKQKLESGYYDRLFPFQILINGVEKFSNRPSFNSQANLRYEAVDNSTDGEGTSDYAHVITFKLKFNFKVETAGQLVFRLLVPIIQNAGTSTDNPDNFNMGLNAFFYGEKLTLKATEGYDVNESIVATRSINYTRILDYNIDVSSSIDNSIINSFGIGYPTSNVYSTLISRTDTPGISTGYHYFSPTTALPLNLDTWKSSAVLVKKIFAEGLIKNVYLQKVSGERELFSSLWNYFNNPTNKMAFLTSYIGFPNIPKDYKAYPSITSGDLLYVFDINYLTEDLEGREYWKIYGLAEVNRYVNSLAKALHSVQSNVIFRLDATAKKIVFPTDIIKFKYDGKDLEFIPTTISIDLFNGTSDLVAVQSSFENITDITYD